MGTDRSRRFLTIIMMITLASIPLASMAILPGTSNGEDPIGTLDAWVSGKVTNGEAGMLISCQTSKQVGMGNPQTLFFNGTTNSNGEFNITVDSDQWGSQTELTPYAITAFSTYYKQLIPGNDFYAFTEFTYVGNDSKVPADSLMAIDPLTSNLTIKVLNKTSGEVLDGARVEIGYDQGIPIPPFATAKATDTNGEALYERIRSVNTSVEVTIANFRPLSETEEHDYALVQEGGDQTVTFNLTERSWPFSVLVNGNDVNHSEPITIDFRTVMDQDSILDTNNFRMWKVDGDVDIPFTLTAKNGDENVDLEPIEDLLFNTTYALRLDTPLKENTGTKPLWRAMTVIFTTELPPGMVTGRVVDEITSEPVDRIVVRISDQISITGSDGTFNFPVVPAGNYKIDLEESYLYNSSYQTGIVVNKGQTRSLGDISLGPKTSGSLKVKVTSGGEPLSGAWVKVIDDLILEGDFIETTNETGIVLFPVVRTNAVTLEAGALHHNSRGDMAFIYQGEEGYLEFDLTEDALPVWVEPVETNSDSTVLAGTDFLVHLSTPITFSTLNVTMWRTEEDGTQVEEIPLTPPERGGDDLTYIVDPMISLPLESSYILIISDELMTLASPEKMLWRNLEFNFLTPDLPLIHINGTLLFEGMVLEDFEVFFEDFSAMTDETGNFNITIDPDQFDVTGTFSINGSYYGYGSFQEELVLTAGMLHQAGTIDLLPVSGWYSISPEPGSENVDPDTVIILNFKESIIVPAQDQISRIVSVVPEGLSAPISGAYVVSNENRTVTFTPSANMDPNTYYEVKISDDLKRWDNVSMFPLGNTTMFKIKPPAITVSVLGPEETSSVPIDSTIRLSFSYNVEKQAVELSLNFDPAVMSINTEWVSGSELKITGYFESNEDYTLTLPGGIYGVEDEPLLSDFVLDFSTGEGYGQDHLLGSPQIFPATEDGWEPGETIRISGSIDNSDGFMITLTLTLDGTQVMERTATINSDGSYSVNLTTPDEEGAYKLKVTIAMPNGPVADELEYDVDVGEVASSTPADNSMVILAIVILIIVVIVIIVAAVIYSRNQRAKADAELSKVEYTDLDEDDWEDSEE